MHLLYTDETNLDPSAGDFFVYGGVVIPGSRTLDLSRKVDEIRGAAGIPSDFQLKFNPRPSHLTHDEFKSVKQAVIEAAVDHECKLLVALILHLIASGGPDEARRHQINMVLYHFDCFLRRASSHGLVLIDRFSDPRIDSILRERFSIGVKGLPYSATYRLEKVVGLHYAAIGQSHFGSVIDIVLGSLRFAVNAFTSGNSALLPSAETLLGILAPLFLSTAHSGRVDEISLCMLPKVVRSDAYRQRYQELSDFLETCGVAINQEIVAERRY